MASVRYFSGLWMTFNEEHQSQISACLQRIQAYRALPIYTHIPDLKGLTKIFFKLSRPIGNLCGGGGVTVLNPKYPRLSSITTIKLSNQ